MPEPVDFLLGLRLGIERRKSENEPDQPHGHVV
jgi:hypothetical protein